MSDTYKTNLGRKLPVPKQEVVPTREKANQIQQKNPEAVQIAEQALEFAGDLKFALELIKQYQRALNMLAGPDPNLVDANNLLRKYNMPLEHLIQPFRIYVDDVDITEHPDSIEGSVSEGGGELERGD